MRRQTHTKHPARARSRDAIQDEDLSHKTGAGEFRRGHALPTEREQISFDDQGQKRYLARDLYYAYILDPSGNTVRYSRPEHWALPVPSSLAFPARANPISGIVHWLTPWLMYTASKTRR
jgi:hypothetical protein